MMVSTDERLPPLRLLVLAVQHVLTMYAGAVTVPLMVVVGPVRRYGTPKSGIPWMSV